MTGSGTWDDPRRPLLTDTPQKAEADARANDDFVNYHYVLSDDEKYAIVEFTVLRPTKANLAKLSVIAASKQPGIVAFEQGKSSRAIVEAEMRKYKKNFNLEEFAGFRMPGGKN